MTRDLDSCAVDYFASMRAIRDPASRADRIAAMSRPPGAAEQLRDLLDVHPAEAWRLTLGLIERAESNEALAFVAAGPLEDLIREHGGAFADRIVAEAHTNERLRKALNYAWGWDDVSEYVRSRLVPLLDPTVRAYWDADQRDSDPGGKRKRTERWRPPQPRPKADRIS
jgi:hypothetical protein